MEEQQLLERITLNPAIMLGKPVIKGTRLTVEFILDLLAKGIEPSEILDEYDGITREDLCACYLFARKTIQDNAFLPLLSEAA